MDETSYQEFDGKLTVIYHLIHKFLLYLGYLKDCRNIPSFLSHQLAALLKRFHEYHLGAKHYSVDNGFWRKSVWKCLSWYSNVYRSFFFFLMLFMYFHFVRKSLRNDRIEDQITRANFRVFAFILKKSIHLKVWGKKFINVNVFVCWNWNRRYELITSAFVAGWDKINKFHSVSKVSQWCILFH